MSSKVEFEKYDIFYVFRCRIGNVYNIGLVGSMCIDVYVYRMVYTHV